MTELKMRPARMITWVSEVLQLLWLVSFALGPVTVMATELPNILLLCVDDLRPELGCYGVDYIQSPHIDRLASQSRVFTRHYVQAPTCGASRFTLLTGRYGGAGNNALFQRATAMQSQNSQDFPVSLPGWFRQHGYCTVSVGKVSHHPGGRGGPDWDDPRQLEMPGAWNRHLLPSGAWLHPRGVMHGLANGEIRDDARAMDVFQSVEGLDSIYPDGLITDEALLQLNALATDDARPFFLAVGIIRPHLPFGAPAEYMRAYRDAELPDIPHPHRPTGRSTWHPSGEFMKYNRWGRDPNQDAEFALDVRKHYAACVSYADAQVGRILEQLSALGLDNKTVVILWGDHGWHLGEHGIWGKHSLFEESLRSPLLIRTPQRIQPGATTQSVVETLDIFPTLCELAGLPTPNDLPGVSLVPIVEAPDSSGHAAISYFGGGQTIRTSTHRLILHPDGFTELYDHRPERQAITGEDAESTNIAADEPELVAELGETLTRRLSQGRWQPSRPTQQKE